MGVTELFFYIRVRGQKKRVSLWPRPPTVFCSRERGGIIGSFVRADYPASARSRLAKSSVHPAGPVLRRLRFPLFDNARLYVPRHRWSMAPLSWVALSAAILLVPLPITASAPLLQIPLSLPLFGAEVPRSGALVRPC